MILPNPITLIMIISPSPNNIYRILIINKTPLYNENFPIMDPIIDSIIDPIMTMYCI